MKRIDLNAVHLAIERIRVGEITQDRIAKESGLSQTSIYRLTKILKKLDYNDKRINDLKKGILKIHSLYKEVKDKENKRIDYKICNICKCNLPVSQFYDHRRECSSCFNKKREYSQRKKHYSKTITGEKYIFDKKKLEGINFDEIEESIKGENAHKNIGIID